MPEAAVGHGRREVERGTYHQEMEKAERSEVPEKKRRAKEKGRKGQGLGVFYYLI